MSCMDDLIHLKDTFYMKDTIRETITSHSLQWGYIVTAIWPRSIDEQNNKGNQHRRSKNRLSQIFNQQLLTFSVLQWVIKKLYEYFLLLSVYLS